MRGRIERVLLVLVLAMSFVVTAGRGVEAATTFTVNSTGDQSEPIASQGDGKCDFDPATAGDQCTLRAAIGEANAHRGAETINFGILGGGVHTIAPLTALPGIDSRVTIDGYTQSGAFENTIPLAKDGTDAILTIVLNGSSAPLGTIGLALGDGASKTVIRGLVISGFGTAILAFAGKRFLIEGNFVGTNASGTAAVPNLIGGVSLQGAGKSVIGGPTPAARNLISASGSNAVQLGGDGRHRLEGNLIGVAKDGVSPLGNGGDGVAAFSSKNVIGDADLSDGAGAANVIANSGDHGVSITGSGNRIMSNSIFSNSKLGINLVGGVQDANGVTANDPDNPATSKMDPDSDTGANGLQNTPVITSATTVIFTSIFGTLESTPKKKFIVQFFRAVTADPSGFGEGPIFLGEREFKTDAMGHASVGLGLGVGIPEGEFVTATATNIKTGETSEFSNARMTEPFVFGP